MSVMSRHPGVLGELSPPRRPRGMERTKARAEKSPGITTACSLQGAPEAEGCQAEASTPPHSSQGFLGILAPSPLLGSVAPAPVPSEPLLRVGQCNTPTGKDTLSLFWTPAPLLRGGSTNFLPFNLNRVRV